MTRTPGETGPGRVGDRPFESSHGCPDLRSTTKVDTKGGRDVITRERIVEVERIDVGRISPCGHVVEGSHTLVV